MPRLSDLIAGSAAASRALAEMAREQQRARREAALSLDLVLEDLRFIREPDSKKRQRAIIAKL